MVRRLARFAWQIIYARYLIASGIALGIDLSSFLLLLRTGVSPVAASLTGYMTGLCVHWLLSLHMVFPATGSSGLGRYKQKLLFLASALVGLAITGTIVGIGHSLGLDARLAKLGAVVISFQVTYLLRRSVVFA